MYWIYGSSNTYLQKLQWSKLLPLTLYIESHNLVLIIKMINGLYDFHILENAKMNKNETRQGQNDFLVRKNRPAKCDENSDPCQQLFSSFP